MNGPPPTLNTVLKYALCLYIVLGTVIKSNVHLSKAIIKLLTICLLSSIFVSLLYDPPLSLLLCVASVVFVMTYVKNVAEHEDNKTKNELFKQSEAKIQAPTFPKQIPNDAVKHQPKPPVVKQRKETKETIISRTCNVSKDRIQEHLDKTNTNLEDIQTNIFDELNYNIHFNELKAEHYNTQGINEQDPSVIGYDTDIYLFP